VNNEFASI